VFDVVELVTAFQVCFSIVIRYMKNLFIYERKIITNLIFSYKLLVKFMQHFYFSNHTNCSFLNKKLVIFQNI